MPNYGIATVIQRPDMVYRSSMIRPENASRNIVRQAYEIAADFTSDPRTTAGQYLSGLGAPIPQAATTAVVTVVPRMNLPIRIGGDYRPTVAVPRVGAVLSGRAQAMGMNPRRRYGFR